MAYAEFRREATRKQYMLFMRRILVKAELMAFLGALILLGIHGVKNHRKAWSYNKAQVLIHLHDLLTCQRFELIGTFLHVVTPQEEEEMKEIRLRKLLPLVEHIKDRCLELYQPVRELSVDERMVKSKARSHMIQYMKNKPTKWGFKLWVIADPSGFTCDFNIYTGKDERGGRGLSHHVVTQLVEPYLFQGYFVFCDNYYSSPDLFEELLSTGVCTTGTFRLTWQNIPTEMAALKEALNPKAVERGTGYYLRSGKFVYMCWKDSRVVLVMSTAYPGHASEKHASRTVVNLSTGIAECVEIQHPLVVEKYNQFMGGVDKSDQFLAYHNILRKTVRYWKTLFYHLVDIAVVNAFIIYNILPHRNRRRIISENDFRDSLVLQVISEHGRTKRQEPGPGRPCRSDCHVRHGSQIFDETWKA